MTVQREHHQLVLLARELDAGDVSVVIERHLHRAGHAALDVVSQHRHLRVHLARLRILIFVCPRIELVLLLRRIRALVPRERERLHRRFVEPNPCQHLAVGREVERAIEREFLLIHPVGLTVDDFVALAILRNLTLRIVEEQLHEKEVVVTHESNLVAIRRELRALLRSPLESGVIVLFFTLYI